MRTIIAGSRSITDPQLVAKAVAESGFTITSVVSGGARGIDRLGEAWATDHTIAITRFPAEWTRYGRSAGYRRNEVMAVHADALLAIWDGHSPGTRHMIDTARDHGLTVFVFRTEPIPGSSPNIIAG